MAKIITGIQQLGIGVSNVHEAWAWYRQAFGMDIPIFEEAATAALMLPYTGGQPRDRHAVLAINLQGGSGFEIWQYTSRTPEAATFSIQMGDLGIYAGKIRSADIQAAYNRYKSENYKLLTELQTAPSGIKHFFIADPYNNVFEVVENDYVYVSGSHLTGGPFGAIIGVSNIDKALKLYSGILGYDNIIYDETDSFNDLKGLLGGEKKFRRILLGHKNARKGGFSEMFGPSQIELVQQLEGEPRKMFENRLWGDLGFIHLCFDIINMGDMRKECAEKGFPFTVDAGDHFDMGEAAGTFSYIEDPDGTLIEFVETFKVPILKKIGLYLDMKKRDATKVLPKWMLRTLRFNRVK
jgi:catechol 2,3-dioxygenase-like lactoylglutathione lyase family enzyme